MARRKRLCNATVNARHGRPFAINYRRKPAWHSDSTWNASRLKCKFRKNVTTNVREFPREVKGFFAIFMLSCCALQREIVNPRAAFTTLYRVKWNRLSSPCAAFAPVSSCR